MNGDNIENDELINALTTIEFLMERQRFDQAKIESQKVLAIYPDNPRALYNAAWIEWSVDELDQAEQTLERLILTDPSHYGGRSLLATIFEESDRQSEAEHLLIQILKDYPDSAEVYSQYAMLLLKSLHIEKAEKLAAEALKREPDNKDALQVSVFSHLISKGTDAATYRELEALTSQYPDGENTGYTMISVLSSESRNREALTIAKDMLRINPTSKDLLEIVKELRYLTHWSMVPLRPFQKYGWGASITVWFIAVIGLNATRDTSLEVYAYPVSLVFIGFIMYSWVYPPILKKIMGA